MIGGSTTLFKTYLIVDNQVSLSAKCSLVFRKEHVIFKNAVEIQIPL